ncbi:MAG: aminotransferase class III-fold pyridoxal phosphate-dependent enzyme [Pseudomonadota bacterium]
MRGGLDMSASELEQRYTLPVYPQLNFEPVQGSGAWLTDATGRRVLDMYGGHAVAALGYDHPALINAVREQLEMLPFQSNVVAMQLRGAAAEALVAFTPPHLTHAFFCNSGGEANENALRLAFLATGRQRVIAVEHAFHGRTAAASAVTWGSQKRWYAFPNTPFEVTFVPRDDVEALSAAFADDVAAVIVEPVQGVAGAYDLSTEFLAALAANARRVGALFIADEVQSGMGRSGMSCAIEHAGVEADIVTFAKSLGGGIPCAALVTTQALADVCKFGDLGTTFGGGPLAAAAILAVCKTITHERLMDNASAREAEIRAACVTGPVDAVQGRGLLLGLKTRVPAKDVRNALLAHDILTGTSGDPHSLRLLPPLTIGSDDIQHLANTLAQLDLEPSQ